MKTIKAQPLTKKAFAPFGEYYSMANPDGYALCGEIHKFYPDRVLANECGNVGFSPILVKKPEKMIVKQIEYHTTTCELILPLNDDMILHVAQPSAGKPSCSQGLNTTSSSAICTRCRPSQVGSVATCVSSTTGSLQPHSNNSTSRIQISFFILHITQIRALLGKRR